ncbi:MAG TPA: hypothetical protein VKG82_11355 [Solirubrobacteraceae bacterium]|nr:hypothetical protein [Solirubrobacteraceae bacterium]
MTSRFLGVLVKGVFAVVVLPGCGGSSSAHRQGWTSTPTTTQAASRHGSPVEIAKDRLIGRTALLRLSDFPAGWTARPPEGESKTTGIEKEAAACLHAPVELVTEENPAKVQSQKFKGPTEQSVANAVTVTPSAQEAKQRFVVFDEPQTGPCLEAAVAKIFTYTLSHPKEASDKLPPGAKVNTPKVEQMSFPTEGNESGAYRITVTVTDTAATLEFKFYLDFALARVGRAGTSLSFMASQSPVSTLTEEELTRLTVRRPQAALQASGT